MIAAATRQDMYSALERAKNTILGTTLNRADAQTIVAQLRTSILQDLHELHMQNQNTLRQSQNQRVQLMLKMADIERSMSMMQQLLTRMVEQQSRTTNLLQR